MEDEWWFGLAATEEQLAQDVQDDGEGEEEGEGGGDEFPGGRVAKVGVEGDREVLEQAHGGGEGGGGLLAAATAAVVVVVVVQVVVRVYRSREAAAEWNE